ncbi:hypothetical protein DIPPA_07020 [Diplonema papillatum]|nr:hypothetical protein DIPPA_19005 [Diplonema papillatum]KAJ9445363.1 hypothetical protein DIPPA_07020 [Diplonema papillatum]
MASYTSVPRHSVDSDDEETRSLAETVGMLMAHDARTTSANMLAAAANYDSDLEESEGQDPSVRIENEQGRQRVLLVSLSVVFIRYGIATFMSPFFPKYCEDHGIGGTMEGLIFSAYPAGMAIMGMFGSDLILRIGTKTSVFVGMLFTAGTTAMFGMVPDVAEAFEMGGTESQFLFIFVYFMSGLIGSLADTGVIILCGEKFKDKSGVVMSAIGTCSGIGCMAGPPLGGAMYSALPSGDVGFRVTFFVWATMALLIIPAILLYIPQDYVGHTQGKTEKVPASAVLNKSVILSLVAIGLSGTVVGSLDPTLSYRLDTLTSALVGVFFMFSSITYTLCGLPIGFMTERMKTRENVGDSRAYKLMQAVGLGTLSATFLLLGPFTLPGGDYPEGLKNVPVAAIAMLMKGVGSAGNNAGYPDLVLDIPMDNKPMQARIDGMWNAAYAMGWALGPALGGGLYEAAGFGGMATVLGLFCGGYTVLLAFAAFSPDFSGGWRGRSPATQGAREAAVVAALLLLAAASQEGDAAQPQYEAVFKVDDSQVNAKPGSYEPDHLHPSFAHSSFGEHPVDHLAE